MNYRKAATVELKRLINNVIDYNEKKGTHIFIGYHPHVSLVSFYVYNKDQKWHDDEENNNVNRIDINYNVTNEGGLISFRRDANRVREFLS